MSTESSINLGYADVSNHPTQNLASAAWVIYTSTGHVVSSGGVCLCPSSNNVAEYSVMIELLRDAISHGIRSLEVRLDSQLVVSQLNGVYCIKHPTLLRILLCVRLFK